MDVPLQRIFCENNSEYIESFNPCFSGCASATKYDKCILYCERDVSILVLVDVPLQLIKENIEGGYHESFNPCFSGCASATYL